MRDDTEAGILDDYLTPSQLADEFRIHPRTLDRWVRLKKAPPITFVGGRRLFRRKAARAWLREREQSA